MKIGFDAKRAFHNNSGLGNYSRDLIRVFLERASKADTFYLFNPKHKDQHKVNLTYNTFIVEPASFFWVKFKSFWRLKYITKLSKTYDLDIYHGLSGEIPLGIIKTKTKTIVTIHDLIFLRYPKLYNFFDRKIHYFKFKYAAKNSNHIIAISEQTKRDIIETFNVPEKKISVVYQSCNSAFKKQYSKHNKEQVKLKYNLPKKFILNVGTIEERKNLLTIVKAVQHLNTPLFVVGKKTGYYKRITQFIEENGLRNRIYFLNNVSLKELAIIYQLSTVFCYPSIFEGFGIPIIEALYSKTPVITSKGSCFPEAAGPDSLYISPYDFEDLSIKIKKLLDDFDYRVNIVELGFKYVQKFSDDNLYFEINNIYKSVLND